MIQGTFTISGYPTNKAVKLNIEVTEDYFGGDKEAITFIATALEGVRRKKTK